MLLNLKPSNFQGEGCKVTRTAQKLDDEDRKIFLDAINDSETWSAHALDIELRKRGIVCTNDTIMAHRRGVCRCQS
jgi:hypothetical protein